MPMSFVISFMMKRFMIYDFIIIYDYLEQKNIYEYRTDFIAPILPEARAKTANKATDNKISEIRTILNSSARELTRI